MNQSPLKFAREFEKLKSILQSLGASDLQIYEMMDFWPLLHEYQDNKSYQSYFDEYVPLFLHLISDVSLSDFSIDELSNLRNILREFQRLNIDIEPLNEKIRMVAIKLASIYFYIGRILDGLNIVADLCGSKLPDKPDIEEAEGVDEFNSFKQICEKFKDKDDRFYGLLKEILNAWEGEREYLSHDRINCLFVEKDGQGKSRRGRLRKLEGSIEATRKTARTDEITFDNQLKSPDDPFVGVAYDSLKAVRKLMGRSLLRKHAKLYYHAYLNIKDSKETFTGDSIGLAIGLLTYVQLLKPEIMRQERLLSSEVAVTGGVDENGKITPVNEETLPAKIERAFFSPIKYLVLPQANYKTAREYLDKLQTDYQNRHLILIGADWLSEVFCNLNIVREQKVCLGEYTVRTVYKYTRMTKIQVPLLVILVYFLVCQIYPNAWVGFDWNPELIEASGFQFIAYNKQGVELWKSDSLKYELNETSYDTSNSSYNRITHFENIDHDKWDEIIISVRIKGKRCARINCYDHNGKLLWNKETYEKTLYPGDCAYKDYCMERLDYNNIIIFPWHNSENQLHILTISDCSPPIRNQIMLFNTAGDKVSGPYINTGQFSPYKVIGLIDVNNDGVDEVYAGFFNNYLDRASFIIFDPINMHGASPPYDFKAFQLSGMEKGTHMYYIAFPKLIDFKGRHCLNTICRLKPINNDGFVVEVAEAMGLNLGDEIIGSGEKDNVPTVNYIFNESIEPIGYYFHDLAPSCIKNIFSKIGESSQCMDSIRSVADSNLNEIEYY